MLSPRESSDHSKRTRSVLASGSNQSATAATTLSSEAEKPCCNSLAKSVYKKVLEGAKKAMPHG